jgi:hypothetical protein
VAGNPQPDETDNVDQVQEYRRLVLEYEALDEEIDVLLARHQGAAEKMSPDDLKQYREMARHRDDVYNQMKALEQQIFQDDENG